MQRIGTGRIENLRVADGEPQLSGHTVKRVISLTGGSGRSKAIEGEFALKASVIDLFRHLDRERDCVIESLIIEDGLPVRLTLLEEKRT